MGRTDKLKLQTKLHVFLEFTVHWVAVWRRVGFGDLGPYFLLSV